jgi:hypothetical protein
MEQSFFCVAPTSLCEAACAAQIFSPDNFQAVSKKTQRRMNAW